MTITFHVPTEVAFRALQEKGTIPLSAPGHTLDGTVTGGGPESDGTWAVHVEVDGPPDALAALQRQAEAGQLTSFSVHHRPKM